MAKGRKKDFQKEGWFPDLGEGTIKSIFSVLFLAIASFFTLAAFEAAGSAGKFAYGILDGLLGVGYYLLPVLSFAWGISFLGAERPSFALSKTIGSAVFLVSGLAFVELVFGAGGAAGRAISIPVVRFFDFYAGLILVSAILIASILVILNAELKPESFLFWKYFGRKEKTGKEEGDSYYAEVEDDYAEETEEGGEEEDEAEEEPGPSEEPKLSGALVGLKRLMPRSLFSGEGRPFSPPPLSLLEKDRGRPGVGDIKANANIIKRTLQNFGISVEMDEVSIGPSITRYALKPAEGVKLSRIVGLQNDLSLALAAHPIRIEAPIPGKSLVGIEIPNTTKTTVGLATLLSDEDYQKSDKPLFVSLGRGITGKSYFGDLSKAPHMLIAGATGSGKSVTIHAIINSLLFRNPPRNLRFIMIDPKRVELTLYNGIPHLLTPVITDAKKTILALKWAAKEMDRRYDILEAESVRDISSYHKNILEPALSKAKEKEADEESELELPERMPYIVIVIDELADIMQAYPRELEAAVVRLAQMSRAVGIHLVLSTQRPSVNIITGLIKANIPSRIALQVSSQIDSRTILDTGGAEKLLGAGDMLYLSGEMAKPQRLQSAFISETEVKKVVKHIKSQYEDELADEISFSGGENGEAGSFSGRDIDLDEDGSDDEMYGDAREAVIRAGKASTSYLQRKLRLGYARAARLMDILEERGVIGPSDGARPRDVLVKSDDNQNSGEYGEEEEEI